MTSLDNLAELLAGALPRFGDRTALVHDGRHTTYAELVEAATRLAHGLRGLGVGPGVPVAIAMRNRAEYVIAEQAVIACGGVRVPLNHMLGPREVGHVLADCAAPVALVDGHMAPRVAGSRPDVLTTLVGVDVTDDAEGLVGWDTVMATPPDGPLPRPDPGDRALLAYTGGTTGRQKGVVHTYATLAANAWSHIVEMGIGDAEQVLLTTPLAHSAGYVTQAALTRGATIHLHDGFDPQRVLHTIAAERITTTFMVPTMIYRLLDCAEGTTADTTSLRTLLYGAAPITVDRLQQGLERLGRVFMQIYAQTEAPNFLTRLRREDHDPTDAHLLRSCGQRVTAMEVAVVDPEDRPVAPGETGEIVARGPYVMVGYHDLPEKSAQTLRGGWLHTGDVGMMDDRGYVHLLDRMNDMIITGGLNVYSTEVETVLSAHRDVAQVAVVGIPHPDWGEAVVAFVVPAGAGVDETAVSAHARAELSSYKRPKALRVVRELPTTGFGKVDKKALRSGWTGW